MKPFEEAIEIFTAFINNYKKCCQSASNRVFSDKEAFFRNLIPFGKKQGGLSGYQRADRFLASLRSEIKKGNIQQTKQVIDFAMNYADKGSLLSKHIWKAIREAAGFTEEHFKYLIPIYQKTNTIIHGNWEELEPSEYVCRKSIELFINAAIMGKYNSKLCLDFKFVINQPKEKDYGADLLKHLNNKINKIELSDMKELKEIREELKRKR